MNNRYVPVIRNEKIVSYKTAYFGKIHVGTGRQQSFTVVFDTGYSHEKMASKAFLLGLSKAFSSGFLLSKTRRSLEKEAFSSIRGSAHLFVPSSTCQAPACTRHRQFYRNESDSAVDLDHDGNAVRKNATRRDQVNIAFGTGEAFRP